MYKVCNTGGAIRIVAARVSSRRMDTLRGSTNARSYTGGEIFIVAAHLS